MKNNWSNIPFYPTSQKKQELINEYGEKRANEIIKYSYEHSNDPTTEILPPVPPTPPTPPIQGAKPKINTNMSSHIQRYNDHMRHINSNQRIILQSQKLKIII
jgi:hypothetical protein